MKKLNTPSKAQDFLNKIPFNFENGGETLKSPIRVLRERNAHCFEGALLVAYILSLQGQKPLILYLKTTPDDFDHVIALFKKDGLWGALSKTNHAVLRYREPIYKNIHELVMSYFHEYFLDNGKKTLRQYSRPFNLNFFGKNWAREEKDLWKVDKKLDQIKHFDLVPKKVFQNLRRAEPIEIQAGKIVESKKKKYNQ